MRCEARREARSVVCDVELDRVPPLLGADPNRARSVSEGVLDEIAECLLHSEAIDSNLDVRRADLELAASISCAPVEAGRDAFEQLVDGDHAEAQRQLPFVGAGEEQEIRGELRQSVGFDPHLAQRSLELCAGARGVERELDFGLDVGERCPQLMARIGDEAPFALHCGLETGKHLVERVAEAGDLVVRARDREPLGKTAGGNRCGTRTHAVDRPQRSRCEQITDGGGDEEPDRTADEQLGAQRRQCVVPRLERGADDDQEASVLRRNRLRQQTHGLPVKLCALDELRPVPCALQLSGREQTSTKTGGLVDDLPTKVQNLGEAVRSQP
jgi:hypothetical protein